MNKKLAYTYPVSFFWMLNIFNWYIFFVFHFITKAYYLLFLLQTNKTEYSRQRGLPEDMGLQRGLILASVQSTDAKLSLLLPSSWCVGVGLRQRVESEPDLCAGVELIVARWIPCAKCTFWRKNYFLFCKYSVHFFFVLLTISNSIKNKNDESYMMYIGRKIIAGSDTKWEEVLMEIITATSLSGIQSLVNKEQAEWTYITAPISSKICLCRLPLSAICHLTFTSEKCGSHPNIKLL